MGKRDGRGRSPTPEKPLKSQRRETVRPPVPSGFQCHVCLSAHWTIDCPRIAADPSKYPHINRRTGCYQCGRAGHSALACPVRRYSCNSCGGMHDTPQCPFSYKPQEWHEFFDPVRKRRFYCSPAKPLESTWTLPSKLDDILWFCETCSFLLPLKVVQVCVQCHAKRPKEVIAPPPQAEDTVDKDAASSPGSSSSRPKNDTEIAGEVVSPTHQSAVAETASAEVPAPTA